MPRKVSERAGRGDYHRSRSLDFEWRERDALLRPAVRGESPEAAHYRSDRIRTDSQAATLDDIAGRPDIIAEIRASHGEATSLSAGFPLLKVEVLHGVRDTIDLQQRPRMRGDDSTQGVERVQYPVVPDYFNAVLAATKEAELGGVDPEFLEKGNDKAEQVRQDIFPNC